MPRTTPAESRGVGLRSAVGSRRGRKARRSPRRHFYGPRKRVDDIGGHQSIGLREIRQHARRQMADRTTKATHQDRGGFASVGGRNPSTVIAEGAQTGGPATIGTRPWAGYAKLGFLPGVFIRIAWKCDDDLHGRCSQVTMGFSSLGVYQVAVGMARLNYRLRLMECHCRITGFWQIKEAALATTVGITACLPELS